LTVYAQGCLGVFSRSKIVTDLTYPENFIGFFVTPEMNIHFFPVLVENEYKTNYTDTHNKSFLGVSACNNWTDFHEILYSNIFQNPVEEIEVSLRSEKKNKYFARNLIYIYIYLFIYLFIISRLVLPRMRNISDKLYRKSECKFYVQCNF
jgi:hypothetical protein